MPPVNTRVVEAKLSFVVRGTSNNADAVSAVEEVLKSVLGNDLKTTRSGFPVSVNPQENASSMTVSVR